MKKEWDEALAITRLNTSLYGFYISSEESPFTFRIEVRLKRPVDGEALRRAVDAAMPRYPYFAVRRIRVGEEYALEDNPLPVVVREGTEPVTLCSEESNFHLIALGWAGDSIFFDASHALMDGTGALPWMKTILYHYLCAREGVRLDPAGIRLAGGEIPAEEVEEPYPESVPDDVQPFGEYKPVRALTLERDGKRISYHLHIAEDAFVKYSREQDGSPATMVSVFLAKAIRALHPEEELPIVGGMALNIRPALGKPLAHHVHVPLLHLKYEASKLREPVTKLATCSRGMVMLQSQPENVLVTVRNYIRLTGRLKSLPQAQKYAMLSAASTSARGGQTFSVSYVGRADWGALEPHLDAVYANCDVTNLGIMVEVMAVNGGFDLCFMQEFEGDAYVRQFAEELAREGIDCAVSGPHPLRIPAERIDNPFPQP